MEVEVEVEVDDEDELDLVVDEEESARRTKVEVVVDGSGEKTLSRGEEPLSAITTSSTHSQIIGSTIKQPA